MVSATTRPAAAAAGTRSWGAKKASRGLRTGRGEIRQETPATAGERALPARRVRERRRASTSRSTERRSSPTVSRGTRVVRSAISSTTPSPRRSRSTSNPSAPVPVRSTTSFRGSTSCTDGWARTRRRSRQRAPRKPSIRARNRSASSIAASTRSAPCRSISPGLVEAGVDQPGGAGGHQGLEAGVEAVQVDQAAVDRVQHRPLGEGGQGLVAAHDHQVGPGGDRAGGKGRVEGEVAAQAWSHSSAAPWPWATRAIAATSEVTPR